MDLFCGPQKGNSRLDYKAPTQRNPSEQKIEKAVWEIWLRGRQHTLMKEMTKTRPGGSVMLFLWSYVMYYNSASNT